MPSNIERQHIAKVTTILWNFLVDITVKNLRFIGERTGAEGMLGVEGKGDILQLVRGCEIPCGCLMSPMLTLHEVPTIIRVCGQRPPAKIGFYAGTTVEGRIGMAIVIREVEETVDATIEGDGKMLWYSLPAVITLDEEETTLVAGVGLCLIEMSVFAGIFLHVAVGIQPPVALQLAHDSWCRVGQTEIVRSDTIGSYLWITHQRFRCILLDWDIAYEGYLWDMLRYF